MKQKIIKINKGSKKAKVPFKSSRICENFIIMLKKDQQNH